MSMLSLARERFSMDKDWKFYLGDADCEVGKGHAEVYHFSKAGGATGPANAVFNDNAWENVDLPHDWITKLDYDPNERLNHGYKPRGIGWYRKCFFLDEADKGKQIILEFDAIGTEATVYFNGSILKRNYSGYNSFVVDVSDMAYYSDKPNILAIKADARVLEGWWYEGAGIYRHVYLTKKSSLHIAHWGIWVNPKKLENGDWDTQIETTIENSEYVDQEFTLVSKIIDKDGIEIASIQTKAVCVGGEKTVIKQNINISNPLLWDIDSPNLYTLVSNIYKEDILIDDEITTYGYRSIRFCPKTGFYLNDRPVKLMGTCNHQDHAGVGVAVPDSIQAYRIRRLKEMGSNAYRCAHNNPAKEILDECDKQGMLVMDENRHFESSDDVILQVEGMVKRDRNHPSVIMYSIFNEEPLQGTPQGREIAKRLMHIIKRLDNTKPVLGALNGGVMQENGTADILDITGVNYSLGVFDSFHEKHPNQLVVGSESASAFSTRGVYKTDLEKHVFDSYDIEKAPWGATVRTNWQAVNTRDFVMGTFVWTGFDYLGEPTPFTWPSVSTAFGIMDLCGFAKDAFYLHKACWTKEPLVHILPHWNWAGMEGETIKVMTHTNCEEVELFLNDVSQGKKPTPIYEQAEWEVPYEAGTLLMKGFIGGAVVAEAKVETTTEATQLVLEPDRDFIFGDGIDSIVVNVCAVDSKGRFVPTTSNQITFTLEGAGQIIGVGNGDPNSHEPYVSNQRSLFSGRCQAIVQSLEGVGQLTIIAEAKGLESAKITIEVKEKQTPKYIESVHDKYLTNWRMTSELAKEKPDANVLISDSDMNTWEPVILEKSSQSKFDDKVGMYALYRTSFNIPKESAEATHVLKFYLLLGHIEFYVNGEKIGEIDAQRPTPMTINLPQGICGEQTLTVLVQSIGTRAGICNSVVLR